MISSITLLTLNSLVTIITTFILIHFSGRNRLFRPKLLVSAKILYDFAFLLQIFNQNLALKMVFQPKSRKPKMKKAETPKLKHISAETEPKLFRFAH